MSQLTHFATRVDLEVFDGIAWFHRNKHCFVAYDKLFLEKSLGTHFFQLKFLGVRPIVLQPLKNLAWFLFQKTNFSRFYICHDIWIGSFRCHGHHGTLMAWLCDVIDTDFIYALHPNMRSAIPVTTNLSRNTGGPRHPWWNCMISLKQTLLCCLW
jgi:hypothetical protein